MKIFTILTTGALLLVMGCSDKYDKKRTDIERQEAIEMVKDSDDIEIDKGWGNDKIILKDQ